MKVSLLACVYTCPSPSVPVRGSKNCENCTRASVKTEPGNGRYNNWCLEMERGQRPSLFRTLPFDSFSLLTNCRIIHLPLLFPLISWSPFLTFHLILFFTNKENFLFLILSNSSTYLLSVNGACVQISTTLYWSYETSNSWHHW